VIHDIIYRELVQGIFTESSARQCRQLIQELQARGAQGIILGCTELPLLMNGYNFNVPIFDTTKIHARRAIDLAFLTKEQKAIK
jgi:aspartate racemase